MRIPQPIQSTHSARPPSPPRNEGRVLGAPSALVLGRRCLGGLLARESATQLLIYFAGGILALRSISPMIDLELMSLARSSRPRIAQLGRVDLDSPG